MTRSGYRRDGAGYLRRSLPALELDYQTGDGSTTTSLSSDGPNPPRVVGRGRASGSTSTARASRVCSRRTRRRGATTATSAVAGSRLRSALPNLPSARALGAGGSSCSTWPATVGSTWSTSPARRQGSSNATDDGGWAAVPPVRVAAHRRLRRPEPADGRPRRRRPGRRADHRGRRAALASVARRGRLRARPPAAACAPTSGAARGSCSTTAPARCTWPTCPATASTDLVRVRNGEVCYWPNLGHGRFGAKVTMAGAPRFDAPDASTRRSCASPTSTAPASTDVIYLAGGRGQDLAQPVGQRLRRSGRAAAASRPSTTTRP